MSSPAGAIAHVTSSSPCARSCPASCSSVTRQSVCVQRGINREILYSLVSLQRRLPGSLRRRLSRPRAKVSGEDCLDLGDMESTEVASHTSNLASAALLGASFLLLTANSAEAISDPGPHYTPIASDLHMLAQNVCSMPITALNCSDLGSDEPCAAC